MAHVDILSPRYMVVCFDTEGDAGEYGEDNAINDTVDILSVEVGTRISVFAACYASSIMKAVVFGAWKLLPRVFRRFPAP